MFAHEAWKEVTPPLNHEVLEASYAHEKKLYRRLVQEMAQNLRKRPQMLLDMPRTERHALFHPLLALPHFDLTAQNLIIVWLSETQAPMMAAFLDALGIGHDGKGYADGFPDQMEAGRLKAAVDSLYGAFPADAVGLYLRVMDRISGVDWSELPGLVRAPKSLSG
jgi:hypothetical protein